MAWMQVIGECVICGIMFSFNVHHVPSVVVDGVREPVCRDCMNRANAILESQGREPHWIHPEAYEPDEVP